MGINCVVISDVHIRHRQDEAYQLFLKFLNHPRTLTASKIILLGDIFDLICGPFPEYFKKYPDIFDALAKLMKSGKEIHYFEGNHDVHLHGLWPKFLKVYNLNSKQFFHHTAAYQLSLGGKNYFFSHGDDIEIENLSYKIYKTLLMSLPMKLIINYLVPFRLVDWVGNKMSKASRAAGRNYDLEKVKDKFRRSFLNLMPNEYDYVIIGHSHVQDEYNIEIDGKNRLLLNNGFALNSKTFLSIQDSNYQFVPLV